MFELELSRLAPNLSAIILRSLIILASLKFILSGLKKYLRKLAGRHIKKFNTLEGGSCL